MALEAQGHPPYRPQAQASLGRHVFQVWWQGAKEGLQYGLDGQVFHDSLGWEGLPEPAGPAQCPGTRRETSTPEAIVALGSKVLKRA